MSDLQIITTKFPPELLAELEGAAEEQDCTRSELIRRAVDRELARLQRSKVRAKRTRSTSRRRS